MPGITQVRWSGFGGQGIVLAGILLGEAGVIDGKHVSGSNAYGAQARGSECTSEIIFSDGFIDYPHLTIADILIAMSQGAYDLYSHDVRETSGFILYDRGLVIRKEDLNIKQVGLPVTEYSLKKLKNKQVANIVLLGALVEITRIVSPKAIREAIHTHVAERFRDLNVRALQEGTKLGRGVNG